MSEIKAQQEIGIYDALKQVPSNAQELEMFIQELVACERHLIEHPRSLKASKRYKLLDGIYDKMFEGMNENNQFIAEYLEETEPVMVQKETLVKKGTVAENDKLNSQLLSRNVGNLYSLLGDFYEENDDEKQAGNSYLKGAEHLKFSLDTSKFKNDYEGLKSYAWCVIKYFENEDYKNIKDDNLLTDLKRRILFYVDKFEEKSDLFEDLAKINSLLADYFAEHARGEDGELRKLTEAQKKYIISLYEEAVRFAKKAFLNSGVDEDSAEQTYIDINLHFSRFLFLLGNETEANSMCRDLLERYKTPEAKVEIARQMLDAYGNTAKTVLDMAKGLLGQAIAADPKIITAHYLNGKIVIAEHTFDIEETIEKLEKEIKKILELDPEDKEGLANDLAESLTNLRSTLFQTRASRVFDSFGSN